MTAALTLEGVTVRYGGVLALHDVHVEVPHGALVGLIGPNGAGKTTLIDAASGFTPHTGHVLLEGRDLGRSRPDQRARQGLARTWQAAELFDDLSVLDNALVGSHDDGSARRAIAAMELEDLEAAFPHELSNGQRKRAGVARALAADPVVVMLDEPAAGLDTHASEALGRSLRAIADEGTAMLLVDHDMGLVMGICDHVVVLDFGRVIAAGSPSEITRDAHVVDAYLGSPQGVAS
jgi:ABC-type branched-subunit amino acid transport system ATPase component